MSMGVQWIVVGFKKLCRLYNRLRFLRKNCTRVLRGSSWQRILSCLHIAGQKSVNMKDVIISAHRNKHLADSLRFFSYNLKAKEPQSEKKRKKSPHKEDRAPPPILHIDT